MLTVNEWRIPIDLLGVPAEFHQTKVPNAVINLPKVGLSTVSKEDSQLIQSIGFGGRIITVKLSDMGATVPVKFDMIKVHNKQLVLDSVQEVLEPGTGNLMGWRCFVKGT
jgi:hypothetical protein